MRTFPDWRAVGSAMRWARANGATVTIRHFGRAHEFPGGTHARYRAHVWRQVDGQKLVTVGSYAGRTDPDLTATNGDQRRDVYPDSGEHALLILAALGLIPAELAQVAR